MSVFPQAHVAARAVHRSLRLGDGDFLMSGHELAAAMQEPLPVVVLVVNNGMYGINPDFVALGKAFGAYAERIVQTDEFPARSSARSAPVGRRCSNS